MSADGERRAAVEEHAGYICAETLAVELTFGTPASGFTVREVMLDGAVATVGLVRAP